MANMARLKATVYVGGLDNAVDERILSEAFLPFGEVVDISIPKPEAISSADPHRGFGYVEFELAEDAQEAIDNMDQSELFGRVLKVAPAKPQKEGNEGLGSKVAVWEQEGWLAQHAQSEGNQKSSPVDKESTAIMDSESRHVAELVQLDFAGPQPVQAFDN